MRLLTTNEIKTATITALTETPGYTFNTALKDTRLSRKGRTLSKDDQTIVFDLGSAKAISYFVLLDHNLTSSAVVHIQGNASNSWGAPTVDITITIADYLLHEFSPAQTLRYWRLTIDDPTNTNDYIQFSKVYLGAFLQAGFMGKDQKLPLYSTSTTSESNSGQLYGDPGYFYRAGTINFKNITNANRLIFNSAFKLIDKYTPIIAIIWEADLTLEPPFYCTITNDPDWQRADSAGAYWNLSMTIKETF